MFPKWASSLHYLYFRLRTTRPASRPTARTWQRKIRAEKNRLLAVGVDPFQLHAVCRVLRHPNCERTFKRAMRVLE